MPLLYWSNRVRVVCSAKQAVQLHCWLVSWTRPLWNIGSAQFAGKTSGTVVLNLLGHRLFWIARLWQITCSLITILNHVFLPTPFPGSLSYRSGQVGENPGHKVGVPSCLNSRVPLKWPREVRTILNPISGVTYCIRFTEQHSKNVVLD